MTDGVPVAADVLRESLMRHCAGPALRAQTPIGDPDDDDWDDDDDDLDESDDDDEDDEEPLQVD